MAEDTQVDGSQLLPTRLDANSSQPDRLSKADASEQPISPTDPEQKAVQVLDTAELSDVDRWRLFSSSIKGDLPFDERRVGEKHSRSDMGVALSAGLKRSATEDQGIVGRHGEHRFPPFCHLFLVLSSCNVGNCSAIL